ncbi:MAG: hypothetical protein C4527_16450 [Candidatus Omnitrophota bacterium]|jgi:uncharacterized protein (DUF608 family)|nr:MAG: hypothetical protein C4527_16450 [Candidatus Omnitrophota bacterium]
MRSLSIIRLPLLFLWLLTGNELSHCESDINQQWKSGLPLGGLGTGKIELMADGSFDRFSINNNPHRQIEQPKGCFAALAVSTNSKTVARKLILKQSDPRGIQSIRFQAAFPFVTADYDDPDLPVSVRLKAFSPLVTGNERDSSIPAAVLIYTVTNESKEQIDVSLSLAWQNWIGVGGTANEMFMPTGECIHEIFEGGGIAGVRYQFKTNPVHPQANNALGDYTLLFNGDKKDQLSFLPMWMEEESPETFWQTFEKSGAFPKTKNKTESLEIAGSNRPSAAVCARRTLPAGQAASFVFVAAWHMPHWITEEERDLGVYYANQWNSSYDAARDVAKRWERLRQDSENWQKPYWDSTLPYWLTARAFNGFASLTSSSIFLKDGTFSALTGDEQWPGNMQSPEELLVAYPLLRQFYPKLLESMLHSFVNKQLATGEAPSAVGNIYSSVSEKEAPGGYLSRPDSTAAFIIMLFDYYLWTGGQETISAWFPHLRSAIYWLMRQDTNNDEIPDGPSLWFSHASESTTFYTADLWLAALRIGEELGGWFGDMQLQSSCRKRRELAQKRTVGQFWTGNFFKSMLKPPSVEEERPSFSLAFPGEWFALSHGWRTLLDEKLIQHHVLTISNRFREMSALSYDDSEPTEYEFNSGESLSGCHEAFYASLLARMGESGNAMSFMKTIGEKPSLFDGNPRPMPLHGSKTNQPSLAGTGAWAFLHSLSGVALDMHRRCLIVGPVIPSASETLKYPFQTPVYSGMLQYRKSPDTGQEECTLIFDSSVTKKDLALQQIAFQTPAHLDSNQVLLRVLLNGNPIAGQDFSREALRVYSFETPLQIRVGDTLTLFLAASQTASILIRPNKQEISNFGARCAIEKLSRSDPGLSFQLINLLRERQIVHLEVEQEEQKENEIYVNGEKLIALSAQMESLPILLQASPIPYADYILLRQAQIACADCVRRLVSESTASNLKSRLWSLQESVDKAVMQDSAIRGIRIDVYPPDSAPKKSKAADSVMEAHAVVNTVANAKKQTQQFMKDLPSLCNNPVLASELAGYFLPVNMSVSAVETDLSEGKIEAAVQIQNPLKIPVSMRVQLLLPEGWSAATSDTVSFDARETAAPAHRIIYAVTATTSLWERRYDLTVSLAGTWDNVPFRCDRILSVGHSLLKQWLIIGPFANQRGEGFDQIHPLETNIQPNESYKGLNQSVQWQKQVFPTGFVDFDTVFSPNDYAVGYAYVGVYSPREQTVRFELGSADGIKIFHNYKEIFAKRRIRGAHPGAEQFYSVLYEGWNHILVKVAENTGKWGFYFEITDLQGRTIPELAYSLEKL